VVTPAGSTTFKRPSLLLVLPQAEQASDFEDVTLEPGQSHAFHTEATGTLSKVTANFQY